MKRILLAFFILSCMRVSADNAIIETLGAAYGFSLWPNDAYSHVITNWLPEIDLSLPEAFLVDTNRTTDYVVYTIFEMGMQVADIRAEVHASPQASRIALLNFFSNCQTTQIFPPGTNRWNAIGTYGFANDESISPHLYIFYRNNVLVSISSTRPEIPVLPIARAIDTQILDISTNAVMSLQTVQH